MKPAHPSMKNHPIGAYIAKHRSTVGRFCKTCGISRTTAYRLIRGEGVSLQLLDKIQEATGLSAMELFRRWMKARARTKARPATA